MIYSKAQLIADMAQRSNLTKTDAEKALNAYIEAVMDALKQGNEIRLIGFGTFSVVTQSARETRNPATGEKIFTPEKQVPRFKAGKELKDAVLTAPKKIEEEKTKKQA